MIGVRGRAVCIVGACAGGLFAMLNCADPTQIIVEVVTDACPGSGKSEFIHATGIAVGTASNIDGRRPSATREGCESEGRIGSLVIYPRGDSEAEVAIKVLGGVERAPDRCDPPDYAGCIVARRMVRFAPNATRRVTVRLSLTCLNRLCPTGTTCDNGACVDEREILLDGQAVPDAARTEAGEIAPVDAADVPVDPCAGCSGRCEKGTCFVDCSKVDCGGEVCAGALPCSIACPTEGSCADVACTTSASCSVACTAPGACQKVSCKAGECSILCKGDDSCNDRAVLSLVALARARLRCEGKRACRTAVVSCSGRDCGLTCDPIDGAEGACPIPPRPCVATQADGCHDWDNPRSK